MGPQLRTYVAIVMFQEGGERMMTFVLLLNSIAVGKVKFRTVSIVVNYEHRIACINYGVHKS